MVVLPILHGTKLIGSGELYKTLGVVTRSNYYIVSSQNLATVRDPQGKRIALAREGAVAELTCNIF